MFLAITGVMTLLLVALVAGKRQHARRKRARREYYTLFYSRRAATARRCGLFVDRAGRPAPLFRA